MNVGYQWFRLSRPEFPEERNSDGPYWNQRLASIEKQDHSVSTATRFYIGVVILLGALTVIGELAHFQCADPLRFAFFFVASMVCSTFKIVLSGIPGSLSVFNIVVMMAILTLSPGETLVMGLSATFLQTYWHSRVRPQPVQLVFNLANVAIAIAGSFAAFALAGQIPQTAHLALRLTAAAAAYFLLNTFATAGVIALTSRKNPLEVWSASYFWTFPYYLLGATIAGAVEYGHRTFGWQVSVLVLPLIYGIYRSYQLYLTRMEQEKSHAQELAGLHLRTIEALALAIEAKDDTTHDHLRRVQVYAEELGKELQLNEKEMQALQAASILHDIGKLAVPDYIISKPGKLTPEEFEKMKIHPVVGAEILERVEFPYPVVPVVRHHHEKWDGSGYPDGLTGENIPIGSRIISAVDCLDALASHRQYRPALPLEKALGIVVSESGKAFDPKIVEILQRRAVELEKLARSESGTEIPQKLSTDVKIVRGSEPGAGFEATADAQAATDEGSPDFLERIARARQEMLGLLELIRELGNSLSLHESIALFDTRIKPLIPHDAMAVYTRQGDVLQPAFVIGESNHLFSSLEIPIGQGLSGWVAENKKAIVNGNPAVEPGYLNDPTKITRLRSALAIPLEGANGSATGVLALYHLDRDAFSKEHLRILTALSPKITAAIYNALQHRQAEQNVATDALTGLPNSRSLFLHLDAELSRCRRTGVGVTVLVFDLENLEQLHARAGQATGGEVLAQAGRRIRESLREYDYVARMGGSEFVIVLPEFPVSAVANKIEMIRNLTMDAAKGVCQDLPLYVRTGYASYPEDGADADDLLAQADRRVNASKKVSLAAEGRDLARAGA